MKILYRFKLDPDTGEITINEITNYVIVKDSPYRDPYYCYRGKSVNNYVKFSNIDRMFCNQVYTFEPNPEHAKQIMLDALYDKAEQLKKQYEKVYDTFAKLKYNSIM